MFFLERSLCGKTNVSCFLPPWARFSSFSESSESPSPVFAEMKILSFFESSKGEITSNKSFFFLIIPLVNLVYFLSYTSISQTLGSEAMNGPAYVKIRNTSYLVAAICLIPSTSIKGFNLITSIILLLLY